MKKTIILLVFLLVNVLAFGQNVGLRIGRNISNFSFNKDSLASLGITKDNLAGWAVAIPVEFKVNKNISVQTDLGFIQKGFKSVQNVNTGSSTVTTELKNYTNYAILPVMLRFHTAGRFLQAYANVGPDAAFAINAKSTGTTTTGTTKTEVSQDVSLEGSKRLSVGLQGGAGLKFKVGKIALVLDGRFLTDLKDSEGNFNVQGLKDKAFSTKNWVTSFGVVFGR
ncbi:MAG: PorT family protein [Saprospiraceae bacterium]|nr:PorT family protein [Saprospiraceae bacterium]